MIPKKRPSEQMIFGSHSVIEALRSGKEIEKILMKKDLMGEVLREVLKTARERNIPYQMVQADRLDYITQKNHQGIIAFISPIEYQPIEQVIPAIYEKGEVPLILILDHITDVRNMGAIARTAECAGVHAIIVPDKGSAQINADAIKTSSGALNIIPMCRVSDLVKTTRFLQDSGLKIIAASEKASELYYQANYKGPLAIIMGAEDTGIMPTLLKFTDNVVRIPLKGEIESLNVSVAAGLMLFEAVRQRAII
jgi:23S rRNA (guanosine2251-2'-O)-methyltransferase